MKHNRLCSTMMNILFPVIPQITALSENRPWSIETSPARHYQPTTVSAGLRSEGSSSSYGFAGGSTGGFKNGGGGGSARSDTIGGYSR